MRVASGPAARLLDFVVRAEKFGPDEEDKMSGGGGMDQARFETRRLDNGGIEIRVRQDGYCDSGRGGTYSDFGYLTPWVTFEDGDVSADALEKIEALLFPYVDVARSFRNEYYENRVEGPGEKQTTCWRPDCNNKAWYSALTHEPLLCPDHTKRVFTEVPDDRG